MLDRGRGDAPQRLEVSQTIGKTEKSFLRCAARELIKGQPGGPTAFRADSQDIPALRRINVPGECGGHLAQERIAAAPQPPTDFVRSPHETDDIIPTFPDVSQIR